MSTVDSTPRGFLESVHRGMRVLPTTDEWGGVWLDVKGRVRLADGTEMDAVLTLCASDSGEHYGTALRLPDGTWTEQHELDFLERLGRTREQVFPYRYTYEPVPDCDDIHLGPDGWSR